MSIKYAVTDSDDLPKPCDWRTYDEIDAMIAEDRRGRLLREAVGQVSKKKDTP